MVQVIAPVMLSEGAKIASIAGTKAVFTASSSIGAYVASDKLVGEKYKKDVKSGKYTEKELKKKKSHAIVKMAIISGICAGIGTIGYLIVTKKISTM